MTAIVHNLVPRMFIEEESRAGRTQQVWKFVVVQAGADFHFVTGPIDQYPYHAHLVAQFCDKNDIPSTWVKRPDLVEIHDPGVKIRGGGQLHIDLKQNQMKLHGHSTAYGPFSADEVDEAVCSDPFFAGFKVLVRGQVRRRATD